MTWNDELARMAADKDDEFGSVAVFQHMVAKANERARADATKPRYEICGVFHEGAKPEGMGRKNGDGLHQTWLTSTRTTFSSVRTNFKWPPTQGDVILLVAINRIFRVLDIEYEMVTRTRLVLEATESIPAA
jgi:hypothetical protein